MFGSAGSPASRHSRKQRRHIASRSKPGSGGVTWEASSLPQALFGCVPVRMLLKPRPLLQISSHRIMRKYKPEEKKMSRGGGVLHCKARGSSVKHFTAPQMQSFDVHCHAVSQILAEVLCSSFVQRFDKSRNLTASAMVVLSSSFFSS